MKSLLSFLFCLEVALVGVAWWKDWFTFKSEMRESGHRVITITLDIDQNRVANDLQAAKAKSSELLHQAADKLSDLKERSDAARGEQKSKIDKSSKDIETKRRALELRLDSLSSKSDAEAAAEKHALELEIEALQKSIDSAAAAGH